MLPATARGRFGAAISVAAVAGVLLGIALHVEGPRSSPSFALPLFHGQADWAPGQRRAPAFALRDQDGQAVSLASQRGDPLLIAFLDTAGDRRSGAIAVSLAEAEALLPRSGRPILDIISLNPAADSPARIRAAAARWHLKVPYHWLTGASATITRLEREYDVGRDAPAPGSTGTGAPPTGTPLYLVDRSGFERAGYLYPFFPTVLARDLERLYSEHS